MRRIITIEVNDAVAIVRGYRAHALALGAGLRPIYTGVAQGWVFDVDRLPELTAYLQYRNIPVEISTAREDLADQDAQSDELAEDAQLALFPPGGAPCG